MSLNEDINQTRTCTFQKHKNYIARGVNKHDVQVIISSKYVKYSAKGEFDGKRPRPMGKPIGKTRHCREKNVENLLGRPKYTNPYPWRDPYREIHKGGRPQRRPI